MNIKPILIALATLIGLTGSAQTLSDSLIAHFPMDGSPNDVIGGLIPTVTSGTPTFCADRFGDPNGAACFDGASFWSYGDVLDMDTSDFTVTFWCKVEALTPNVTYHDYPLAKGTTVYGDPDFSGYSFGFRDELPDTLSVAVLWGDQQATQHVISHATGFDQWHHLALSRCDTLLRFYLDGSITSTDTPQSNSDLSTNIYFSIGAGDRSPGGTPSGFFNGAVDDVRIYKGRCLNPAEILTLAGDTGTTETNQWLHFPGQSDQDRVDLGDLDVPGDQLTVEALFCAPDSLLWPTIPTVGGNIVSKHMNPEDDNYLLRAVSFELSTTSGALFLSNPVTFCPDSVYHVAGTYDGVTAKYYVNGTLVADTAWTGNLVQNDHHTFVGNGHSIEDEQFHGYIDEVRIWNVARTQAEITANMYHLPSPTTQPGLQAYFRFDDDLVNAQGNPMYDGVLMGTMGTTTVNPFFHGAVADTGQCSIPLGFENVLPLDHQLMLYPDPAVTWINIDLPDAALNGGAITILNMLGQPVRPTRSLTKAYGSRTLTLDIANLPKGAYFVVLSTTKGKLHGRFIRE